MKTVISILCIFCLIFLDCRKQDPKTDLPDLTLLNTHWTLSSVQNVRTKANLQFPFASSHTSEYLTFTDSILTVKGMCNSGRSSFQLFSYNDSIRINGVGRTFIYCDFINWEDYLWHNLDSAFSYKINGNQLVIYSKGTYNLNFIAE
jgi:heat shock protein HslJ